MPSYRIFRMKESERQRFRWAPHTSGASLIKAKDFEEAGAIEAPSAYSAWSALQRSDSPLELGDVLENAVEGPRIFKYVGFEEARWILPEVKTGLESVPPAAGVPASEGAAPPATGPSSRYHMA